MRRKIISSALVLFFTSYVTAQTSPRTYHQALYWIRYQNQLVFSPQLSWNNEVDNRRFFNIDVQNQFITHSRLHYKTGAWEFGGGLTASWIFTQIPENGIKNTILELRPVAEASHEFKIRKIFIQNRFRIDNRYFDIDENTTIWERSRYVMRLRYRTQVKIPLKTIENIPRVILKLAEEIMINTRLNVFDQNRLYMSSEFYINKNFSLETGYIYLYQQRTSTQDFYSRNVFRISFLHKIIL
jgi:hypothetical protein